MEILVSTGKTIKDMNNWLSKIEIYFLIFK